MSDYGDTIRALLNKAAAWEDNGLEQLMHSLVTRVTNWQELQIAESNYLREQAGDPEPVAFLHLLPAGTVVSEE